MARPLSRPGALTPGSGVAIPSPARTAGPNRLAVQPLRLGCGPAHGPPAVRGTPCAGCRLSREGPPVGPRPRRASRHRRPSRGRARQSPTDVAGRQKPDAQSQFVQQCWPEAHPGTLVDARRFHHSRHRLRRRSDAISTVRQTQHGHRAVANVSPRHSCPIQSRHIVFVRLTATFVTFAPAIVPLPFATVQIWSEGCVDTVTR